MVNNYIKVGKDIFFFNDKSEEERNTALEFARDFGGLQSALVYGKQATKLVRACVWKDFPARPASVELVGLS